MKTFWRALLAAALFLVPSYAAVAEDARLVVRLEGKVEFKTESSSWKPLFTSRLLGLQDWARTGMKSRARVDLDGSKTVFLGENTQVQIGTVETAGGVTVTRIQQGIGFVRVLTKRGSSRPFEVRTPSATLAVRGTDVDSVVTAQADVPSPEVLQALESPWAAWKPGSPPEWARMARWTGRTS